MPGRCHHEPRYARFAGGPMEEVVLGTRSDNGEDVTFQQNSAYSQALNAFMDTLVEGTCEYGNCAEGYCPSCGAVVWGMGPVLCPCDDMKVFPEQRKAVGPNFIKPSLRRRGWRRR